MYRWFEAHPKIAVGIAMALVMVSIENYAHVVNWAEGIEQVAASESLGG